ncbi:MAG: methylated-DNA--[protein]-cysteine S-methyltransferase [Candidatus Limnocylindrales bacterium]
MVTLASPHGPVHLAATASGICAVELGVDAASFAARIGRRLGGLVIDGSRARFGGGGERRPSSSGGAWLDRAWAHLARARAELERTLSGRPSAVADLPLDWTGLAPFDRRVLEAARGVAWGEVATYAELARRIGAPRAARAVGGAIGRNRFWLLVPCHRIVAAGGRIGGYGGPPYGVELKRELLAREGVVVTLDGSGVRPAEGARIPASRRPQPPSDRPYRAM